MSRPDQPAFPVLEFHEEFDDDMGKYIDVPHLAGGLSKRELGAFILYAGIIGHVGPGLAIEVSPHSSNHMTNAIKSADALLAQLERTP